MITKLQAIRGMPDILPSKTVAWQYLESRCLEIMRTYGYDEIRLPILELTALFKRSIGEVTDIVEKEMFTFQDREGQSLSLRPEGTAGCVRAALEQGLLHNQIQRLWYIGPMFRYERPQKGRYRQFNQVGVETFGLNGADIEAEHILMAARLWRTLGIDSVIELQINSLGGVLARQRYREALINYFSEHEALLDADSKRRLHTNPLRILDSKNADLAILIQKAPNAYDYLEPEDKEHFESLQNLLKKADVAFKVNPRLVRGLDYYNRTVYEWVTTQLGAQGTVCAGGRYDVLVEQLGGNPTPAVGFAIGLERVMLLCETLETLKTSVPDAYLISVGEKAMEESLRLAERFRDAFPTLRLITNCGGGNFKQQFKKADKSNARFAFILGDNELETETIGIKFLREERPQLSLSFKEIKTFLQEQLIG